MDGVIKYLEDIHQHTFINIKAGNITLKYKEAYKNFNKCYFQEYIESNIELSEKSKWRIIERNIIEIIEKDNSNSFVIKETSNDSIDKSNEISIDLINNVNGRQNDIVLDEKKDSIDNSNEISKDLINNVNERQNNIVIEEKNDSIDNLKEKSIDSIKDLKILNITHSDSEIENELIYESLIEWCPIYFDGFCRIVGKNMTTNTEMVTGIILNVYRKDGNLIVSCYNRSYELKSKISLNIIWNSLNTSEVESINNLVDWNCVNWFEDILNLDKMICFNSIYTTKFKPFTEDKITNHIFNWIYFCKINAQFVKAKPRYFPTDFNEISNDIRVIIKLIMKGREWMDEFKNLLKKCGQNIKMFQNIIEKKSFNKSLCIDEIGDYQTDFLPHDFMNSTMNGISNKTSPKITRLYAWTIHSNHKTQICTLSGFIQDCNTGKWQKITNQPIRTIDKLNGNVNNCWKLIGPFYLGSLLESLSVNIKSNQINNLVYVELVLSCFNSSSQLNNQNSQFTLPDNWQEFVKIIYLFLYSNELKLTRAQATLDIYNFKINQSNSELLGMNSKDLILGTSQSPSFSLSILDTTSNYNSKSISERRRVLSDLSNKSIVMNRNRDILDYADVIQPNIMLNDNCQENVATSYNSNNVGPSTSTFKIPNNSLSDARKSVVDQDYNIQPNNISLSNIFHDNSYTWFNKIQKSTRMDKRNKENTNIQYKLHMNKVDERKALEDKDLNINVGTIKKGKYTKRTKKVNSCESVNEVDQVVTHNRSSLPHKKLSTKDNLVQTIRSPVEDTERYEDAFESTSNNELKKPNKSRGSSKSKLDDVIMSPKRKTVEDIHLDVNVGTIKKRKYTKRAKREYSCESINRVDQVETQNRSSLPNKKLSTKDNLVQTIKSSVENTERYEDAFESSSNNKLKKSNNSKSKKSKSSSKLKLSESLRKSKLLNDISNYNCTMDISQCPLVDETNIIMKFNCTLPSFDKLYDKAYTGYLLINYNCEPSNNIIEFTEPSLNRFMKPNHHIIYLSQQMKLDLHQLKRSRTGRLSLNADSLRSIKFHIQSNSVVVMSCDDKPVLQITIGDSNS